jgi:hypothetical protein
MISALGSWTPASRFPGYVPKTPGWDMSSRKTDIPSKQAISESTLRRREQRREKDSTEVGILIDHTQNARREDIPCGRFCVLSS